MFTLKICHPVATPTPFRGIILLTRATADHIHASGGRGVTLGAQVRHVVTYREPIDGTLLYTVFTKKCQKRSKKGVTLFLTKILTAPPTWGVYTRGGLSKSILWPTRQLLAGHTRHL